MVFAVALRFLEGSARAVFGAAVMTLGACAEPSPPAAPTPRPAAPLAGSETRVSGSPPALPELAPSPPTPAAATAATPRSPLRVAEPRERWLDLPGFEPALLVLPRDAGTGPARLVVIAHGAGGRPEPDCAHYLALLGDGHLLACTRGTPNNRHLPEAERGYFYDGHPRLGEELRALFTRLAEEEPFASEVAREGAVYIGYSQGASMGILALHEDAELAARFSSILLVEGGVAEWTVALAGRMAGRGTRVALICGQPKCAAAAARSASWMARAGLEHRVRSASGAGHTFQGRTAEVARELLPWLLERGGGPARGDVLDPTSN